MTLSTRTVFKENLVETNGLSGNRHLIESQYESRDGELLVEYVRPGNLRGSWPISNLPRPSRRQTKKNLGILTSGCRGRGELERPGSVRSRSSDPSFPKLFV